MEDGDDSFVFSLCLKFHMEYGDDSFVFSLCLS